jgi:hypothetical protein
MEDSDGEWKPPRKVFTTFPIGLQIQAHWKNPQTAEEMSYQWKKTQEILEELRATGRLPEVYDDILCGTDYLELVEDGLLVSTTQY